MSVLATENFTGSGALSANWSNDSAEDGAWTRSTDVGVPTGTGRSTAFYTGVTTPASQYAQVKIITLHTVTDQGCGPIVRGNTGADGDLYLAQTNTVETRLYKRVSSAYTQLGADASPCSVNDILKLEAIGNKITVYINDIAVIGPVTDSGVASGFGGIWGVVGGSIDDFEVGDFAAVSGEVVSNFEKVISSGTRPRPFAPGNSR